MPNCDAVVIGAGPGGYVCAIKLAMLGMSVVCVDKSYAPGGTCLTVGCIPSKALLHASRVYESMHNVDFMGIKAREVSFSLQGMMDFKDKVVESNVKGVEFLLNKNKVTYVKGVARLADKGKVIVQSSKDNSKKTYTPRHIIIATGSVPSSLASISIDEKRIVSSTGALSFTKVPEHLVVVGAGYIGLEMACVWSRLGSRVTVVEFEDRILAGMDSEVAKNLMRILQRKNISFLLSHKVDGVKKNAKDIDVTLLPKGASETVQLSASSVLVSVGRKPTTQDLGLKEQGIETDSRGFITTDENFRTSRAGVYAIGDVISGPMLAHKAEEEGVALAEKLAGQAGHVNYDCIPAVIYTSPEVASVGLSEDSLKKQGTAYRVGKFPFTANGRAKSTGNTDGFVKILTNEESSRIVGVHIIGAQAGDMIAEAVAVMELGGSAEDIARTCHAHPTLSEAMKEAALAVDGKPLHM